MGVRSPPKLGNWGFAMTKKAKSTFNPKAFLATANRDRTVSVYPKDTVVYQQAGPADAVFYIQKGRIKITVASRHGKEAVIAILGPDEFFGEGCWSASPCAWARPRR
jgi:CRP/FNR family transcriptional regulator, cyclic AMP receptor protein